MLQTYVDAFVVGDAAAVARRCVPPFLWINAAGTIAATTGAELERTLCRGDCCFARERIRPGRASSG